MGQDVDVARVAVALNMAGIRYQTFGNKPVWLERKERSAALLEAEAALPAREPDAAPGLIVSPADPDAACPAHHSEAASEVAPAAKVQPALDPAQLLTIFTKLRAESPGPSSAMPPSRDMPASLPPASLPPLPWPPAPAPGMSPAPAPAWPDRTGPPAAAAPPGVVNPAAIAAAFQPRGLPGMATPAAPTPLAAAFRAAEPPPPPTPPPLAFPPRAPAAGYAAAGGAPLGGAASLLAALQATAAEAGPGMAGGGLLSQLGQAPPPPVQPAAPSLLATLGVPFAPLGAPPSAGPGALSDLLRNLGGSGPGGAAMAAPAPVASRLSEVLGGLGSAARS